MDDSEQQWLLKECESLQRRILALGATVLDATWLVGELADIVCQVKD